MMTARNENGLKGLPDFVKYPKIPYVEESTNIFGHQGYVFEKIDGSLSQVRRWDNQVLGGSKANFLTGRAISRSDWMSNFLGWMYGNDSLSNLPKGLIMYGEWVGEPLGVKHYDEKNRNQFYFIDLSYIEDGKPVFYDYDEAVGYLDTWGIKGVRILPPIEKAEAGFFSKELVRCLTRDTRSKLGDCEIEGVVLKNYRIQEFGKCLHPKYSEIREHAKTLEEKYINPPRVLKAVNRLRNEGFDNPSLEVVVDEVLRDVIEESGKAFSNDSVRLVMQVRGLYHQKKSR